MGTAPAPMPASPGRQAQQQQHFFFDALDSFMLMIPVVLEAGDFDKGEGFFITHAATVLTHIPSYTSSSFMMERSERTARSASSSGRMPLLPATPVYVPWEAWGRQRGAIHPL
jgi:hypothetical protein